MKWRGFDDVGIWYLTIIAVLAVLVLILKHLETTDTQRAFACGMLFMALVASLFRRFH